MDALARWIGEAFEDVIAESHALGAVWDLGRTLAGLPLVFGGLLLAATGTIGGRGTLGVRRGQRPAAHAGSAG